MTVSEAATVLAGEGLARRYRRGHETITAVDDVAIRLRAGELVGLVGPSGSGKTTLLSVLVGWEELDAGTIRWHGSHAAPRGLAWHQLAIVPQALGLVEELDIADNVTLPARLSGTTPSERSGPDERTRRLLEQLSIDHLAHRLPEETSLGEQQRAAVARALIRVPEVLLADEPTAHQDRGHAAAVVAALREATAAGAAGLVATHDPAVLAQFDRILTMRDGRLA